MSKSQGFISSVLGLIMILLIAAGIGGYLYLNRTLFPFDWYDCQNGISYRTNRNIVDAGSEYFNQQGHKLGSCDAWGVAGENCKETRAKAGACRKRDEAVSTTADRRAYSNGSITFNYPSSWEVKDNTHVRNGKTYPLFHITSPDRFDLPGEEGVGIHYLIQISVNPDDSNKIETVADFAAARKAEDQSPWNTSVNRAVTETTDEYRIGQQIIASFKITGQ